MNIVIMNTKTRQNPSKALTNEYVSDGYYAGIAIWMRGYMGQGALFATAESKEITDDRPLVNVTHDTGMGNREAGEARLVGWVGKDGKCWGKVPTVAVPVYVYK